MHTLTTSLFAGLALLALLVTAQDCEHVRFNKWTKKDVGGVLFENGYYSIEVECADPNYLARVVWTMPLDGATTESRRKWPRWDKSNFDLKPSDTLENDFPNELSPDASMEEAQRFAVRGGNTFVVSQPGKPLEELEEDSTDLFVVQVASSRDYWIQQFVDGREDGRNQGRKDERRKWVLGVAIGVPIGAILLAALAWFVGSRTGKRRAPRPVAKGV
ncbi:hypothetical protein OQA88_11009 [Cercophora sp. LCS_1]